MANVPPDSTNVLGNSSIGGGDVSSPISSSSVSINLTNDKNSTYFLSSSDQPGNIITPVVFRGSNYDAWSKSIELSFLSRRKIGFLEGTEVCPTDPARLADWRCLQATLVQWVLNTIDSTQKNMLPYFTEVFPLWDLLKKRHGVSNGTRKQEVKKALANCFQHDLSVEEYFGKLQPLWDDLNTCSPLPRCSCGEIQGLLQAMLDEDMLHDFMYGLNIDKFGAIRSSLLSQEPLPNLDRAYNAIRQEERLQKQKSSTLSNDMMTLALRSAPNFNSRGNFGGTCSYCHKKGHEISNCYAKNGYPEWWESRGGSRRNSGGPGSGGAAPAAGGSKVAPGGAGGAGPSREQQQRARAASLHGPVQLASGPVQQQWLGSGPAYSAGAGVVGSASERSSGLLAAGSSSLAAGLGGPLAGDAMGRGVLGGHPGSQISSVPNLSP